MSSAPPRVSARAFHAVQCVSSSELVSVADDSELRPVLASLVRLSLISSLDRSAEFAAIRAKVLQVLSRVELVNQLVALLSIEFHDLETDVRKELQLRAKSGSEGSALIANLTLGPALEFERSDPTRRLRLVLSEVLAIVAQIQLANARNEDGSSASGSTPPSSAIVVKPSELFDHPVYLSEVCEVLAVAMAELPGLLSPPEMAEALLRLKFGPHIICHLVANQPDSFNEVVFHLVSTGDKQEDEQSSSVRQAAILMLCEMNPASVLAVRAKCVEWCRMPSLALLLTLRHQDSAPSTDLVAFLSGLLLGADANVRSWISLFIRSGQKRRLEALVAYRMALTERMAEIAAAVKRDKGKMSQANVVKAASFLRLYTALRGIAGMKFSDEEVSLLLDVITCQPPASAAGVKFVSLGLCMLIACNSLLGSPALEKRGVHWIGWLISLEGYFEQKMAASFGEMLLLMAIHFHSGQFAAICDLVCQTLGMKVVIRQAAMTKMKHIFTQEIFTEQVVASHAVKVQVTANLNSEMSGYLPVHCIHQLLKSRAFSKHKVPIKDWIYRQILASGTPLHPVLASLLEVYINSVLVPATGRGMSDQTNEPVSEAEVWAVFRQKSSTAAQLLMLYYVLQYESVRLTHMRTIVTTQRKVLKYSTDLMASMPIKFLLQTAERDQERYGGIFAQLLKLCTAQFPHTCIVKDWLEEEDVSARRTTSAADAVSQAEVAEAFACIDICPSKLTLTFNKLMALPIEEVWNYAAIAIKHISDILAPATSRQIKEAYKRLWFRLNQAYPRKLWTLTANALLDARWATGSSQFLTQLDLTLDPLSVLRCHRAVFRAGPLVEIVLYMLKACLAASRAHLATHISENPITQQTAASAAGANGGAANGNGATVTTDVEREELKSALVATQESAAIQVLLEACVATEEERSQPMSQLSDLKEVQALICSYIHEAFIAEPNLAKLVHFQGYPADLLSMSVCGVPSMHICLDFVPELLCQPDLEKQAFAIDLVSHLSVQYALPKSYSTARLAVNTLSTLLSVLTQEERVVVFPPVLPSLVRICRAFPPLVEDVVSLLLQYAKVCVSEHSLRHYASPRGVNDGDDELEEECADKADPDEAMDTTDENLREVGRQLRRLPKQQPLIAAIQSTFVDILKNSVLVKNTF